MEENQTKVKVVRIFNEKLKTPCWKYLKSKKGAYDENIFCDDVLEAQDLTNMKVTDIVKLYNTMVEKYSIQNVVLVEVTILTKIEELNINDVVFLEERRRQALEKLNLAEIVALGLESVASYNKLRYHKTDPEIPALGSEINSRVDKND
jgi:hypothetical protein